MTGLKELEELPYDAATPLLGTCARRLKPGSQRDFRWSPFSVISLSIVQLSLLNCSLKTPSGNARYQQFASFKLHAVPSSVIKSRGISPHSKSFSVQHILALYTGPLVTQQLPCYIRLTAALPVWQCCAPVTLIFLNGGPKAQE